MQKKISILGSGWLGVPLADKLSSQGHQVQLSSSHSEKIETLSKRGYTCFLIDLGEKSLLPDEFLNCEVLIIAITSKDIPAFDFFIKEITKSNIKQVIFISSTSVYDFCNCEITEHSPTNNSALAEIERLFIAAIPDRTTILRFSGLFGYSRKPAHFFRYKPIPNPDSFVNMIHRDDCIEILRKLVENGVVGKHYNAAADTHPTKQEFYTKASLDLGYTAPKIITMETVKYKIISNKLLKKDLKYQFKYNDLLSIEYSVC